MALPKVMPSYACYGEYSKFFIGETHEFRIKSYSDINKAKSIRRSKDREELIKQTYLKWQDFKKYGFLSLNEIATLFNRSEQTIMKVIKDTELINDLKNIDMSVFVGKYIAYQEKIRLNRIQNSKNLKKVPTKVSDFLNKSLKAKVLWKYAFLNQECFEYTTDNNIFIDPYILGYWLGDGFSGDSRICGEKGDLLELKRYLNEKGIKYKDVSVKAEKTVGRIRLLDNMTIRALHSLDLICNKHVPSNYLMSTKKVRLKLLAGLVDSDGCVDESGNIEIIISNKNLALDIYRLVYSLGIHTTGIKYKTTFYIKNGKKFSGKIAYRICFTDTNIPLNLSRKKNRLLQNKKSSNRQFHNFFKECRRGEIAMCYEIILDSNNIIIPIKNENEIFI